MKCKALILAVCLLAYITELIALPVGIGAAPRKMCCAGNMKMMAHHPCKKPSKNCNTPNGCLNCPLCYVVTIPLVTLVEKYSSPFKKEYAAFQPDYIFIYTSTAWKPPNA